MFIHTHIQIRFEPGRKTSFRHIKLVRRNTKVGQNSIHRFIAQQAEVIFDEGKILVYKNKTGIINLIPLGIRILIEGDQHSVFT
ncbi:hypothetical protein D3C86_1887520 [compost metagenome]